MSLLNETAPTEQLSAFSNNSARNILRENATNGIDVTIVGKEKVYKLKV